MPKRKMNTSNRHEIDSYQAAQRLSKNGSILAVIYSSDFIKYSVKELRPHEKFPDRRDLFDWDSEDNSETALAVFRNGTQLDITVSIAPRKVVVRGSRK